MAAADEAKLPPEGDDEADERTVVASSIGALAGPGAVVQFTIEPDGYIQPVEFPVETSIMSLKEAIAKDMGIEPTHLVIRFFGRVAHADATLGDCGLKAGPRIVEGNVVIDPTQVGGEYKMPSVLVVSVVNDETGELEKEVIVRVSRASDPPPEPGTAAAEAAAASAVAEEGSEEALSEEPWSKGKKPFLGGVIDKRTGIEFHHAATQTKTQRKKPWEGKPVKVSRDTQTPKVITRSSQTNREASTQMERQGLAISAARDRVIVAQPYVSADEVDAMRLEHVMLLQRCWRGFRARKAAAAVRSARTAEAEARDATAAAAAADAAARHRKEVERRVRPRTKKDFAALYGEVESWRAQETTRIKESDMDEDEKKEALAQLLAKQTKMLVTIDSLRTKAIADAKKKNARARLDEMARPQHWQTGDGAVAAVHTPFSERAAELKALYEALLAKPAELVAQGRGAEAASSASSASSAAGGPTEAKEEDDEGEGEGEGEDEAVTAAGAAGGKAAEARVRLLLQVKWTVKEFDCALTREIVELIDREADLLARGRPGRSLRSLRKRLENLFLQFVETPEFNPEAARFQKVPRDLSTRPNVMPIMRS